MICPFRAILQEMKSGSELRQDPGRCLQEQCPMWRKDEQGYGFCGLAGPLRADRVELAVRSTKP